ncbi:glycosyltransferase family 2 protein [Candidatus Bathyarchaeota archaeon A05DMB-2]|jgi:glycosyltransferase involved in cell wall biosynthesis|nr:glycosyltransferase family 2 protein [Candidatus Bathyarchaeota archaeon A05DMB-2]
MPSIKVSVVLPTYNEADSIESAVTKVMDALEKYEVFLEVIIAEDGSTDGTNKKAAVLAARFPSVVKHIHRDKRLGRGNALKNAFKQASGSILVYMDVDLATDVRHLDALIRSVESEGFDIVTGSRMLAESRVKRSGTRHIASKAYNLLVRWLLGSKLKDHQCGFKAFKREPLMQLLDEVSAGHWFWDTEILVRAHRRGYRIKEIPVDWKSGRETKVRLLQDSLSMFGQVISLWWHLKVQNLRRSPLS